jgi:hypothetical protein
VNEVFGSCNYYLIANTLVVRWRVLPMVEPVGQGLISGLAPYSVGVPPP